VPPEGFQHRSSAEGYQRLRYESRQEHKSFSLIFFFLWQTANALIPYLWRYIVPFWTPRAVIILHYYIARNVFVKWASAVLVNFLRKIVRSPDNAIHRISYSLYGICIEFTCWQALYNWSLPETHNLKRVAAIHFFGSMLRNIYFCYQNIFLV